VFTPTYLSGATDGRELANGNMTIHTIDYVITQSPSAYIPSSHSGAVDLDTITSDIPFKFKPLYVTEFTGDLID
jgi:hypothetical protein